MERYLASKHHLSQATFPIKRINYVLESFIFDICNYD
jgi:hypothetical protein